MTTPPGPVPPRPDGEPVPYDTAPGGEPAPGPSAAPHGDPAAAADTTAALGTGVPGTAPAEVAAGLSVPSADTEPTPVPQPEPITPEPLQPEPGTPPITPEPLTPEPFAPEPATPPITPEPITPQPFTPTPYDAGAEPVAAEPPLGTPGSGLAPEPGAGAPLDAGSRGTEDGPAEVAPAQPQPVQAHAVEAPGVVAGAAAAGAAGAAAASADGPGATSAPAPGSSGTENSAAPVASTRVPADYPFPQEAQDGGPHLPDPSSDADAVLAAGTDADRRRLLPVLLVGLLALVLLAGTVALGLRLRAEQQTEQAREQAVAASRDAARLLFSYDHATLDDDFAKGLAVTTGEFRDEYSRTTKDVVAPVARQYKAVVQADVVESAVVEAEPDEVVTLVFLNQATTSTRVEGQQVDQSRVRMRLVERDGRWLVSEVKAL